MNRRPTAVFLDRDGTIIRDVHYLSSADDVEVLAGAASAISRLNDLGIPVIVVTNQSGIARGKFTVKQYLLAQQRLEDLLRANGAHIDATYYCAHHPDFSGVCDCRKPGIALFEHAVAEHALDMTSPGFIGDRWRDVEAYRKLGGTAILISGPNTPPEDVEHARADDMMVVESLNRAVNVLLGDDAR